MYKKYLIFSCLLFLVFLTTHCQQKKNQTEGMGCFSSNLFSKEMQSVSYLFKDSILIYENMVFNRVEEYNLNDTVVKESYDFQKYTYLDLKTLHCQDYYHFSDTAQPYINYTTIPKEINLFDFFGENIFLPKYANLVNLSDTIIDEKVYRRISTKTVLDSVSFIHYLDCTGPFNIFSIDKYLDSKYQGCQTVRNESDVFRDRTVVQKNKIIRDFLTPAEKKYFLLGRKMQKQPVYHY